MEAPGIAHRRVRFGVFEADLDSGELRKSGLKLKLQEQPFQILALLLSRPGEIVSREEIQQKLWPNGTFVDFDHGVNTAVKKLRESLGDEADTPRFIETVPRRGYRFIAPLAEKEQTPLQVSAVPVQRQGISKRKSFLVTSTVLIVTIAGCLLWRLSRSDRAPAKIVASKQLTFSGHVGGTYSTEALPSIQTDGQRIYYTDTVGRLRFISVTGGEEGYVPTDATGTELLHISPDGSRLLVREAFGSTGSTESPLWLVPANGGPRQRLGDVIAQDGAWSPDGKEIAFAKGPDLFITNNQGKHPRKLASTAGRPFWIRWSPDGKRLRFTLNDPKSDVRTIWEANLTGSVQPLFESWKDKNNSCCGVWSPDGRSYLFLHAADKQAELWVSQEGKSLRGNSVPVPASAHQVGVHFVSLASSPSQKRLFAIGSNPLFEAYAVNPKDKHAVQLLPKLPVHVITFSPDGKWISFNSPDANNVLWRARADGTGQIQLTSPPLEVVFSLFSPDASRIAMMAKFPGHSYKIYWVNAEGGTLHELPTDVVNQADPTWTADGQSIIFGEPAHLWTEAGKPKAIYISNLKSGQTSKIPGTEGWFSPHVSPDGRSMVAMSLDLKRLGLFDFATGTWRDLTNEKGPNGPFWSTDGQWVYFNDSDVGLWRVRVKDAHSELLFSTTAVLPSHFCFATGLTPEQSIILPCMRKISDLYALDWE